MSKDMGVVRLRFKTDEEKELERRMENRKASIKCCEDEKQKSIAGLISKLKQGNLYDKTSSILDILGDIIIVDWQLSEHKERKNTDPDLSRATLKGKYEKAIEEKIALNGLAYRFMFVKELVSMRRQEAEQIARRIKDTEDYIQSLLNEFDFSKCMMGGVEND